MKPTQGKCKDCNHSHEKTITPDDMYCDKLDTHIKIWWTGCVMWEKKEVTDDLATMEIPTISI